MKKTINARGLLAAVVMAAALAGCGTAGQAQDAAQPAVFTEADGIFAFRVGNLEVFTLVELQQPASAAMLLGADEAMELYLAETGALMSINAFLIKAPGQNILIDAGLGAGGIILERIRALGLTEAMIDAVLLTHLHGDHFGGLRAGGLEGDGPAAFPNARVYVSGSELEHFTEIAVNQTAVEILALYEGRLNAFESGALGAAAQPLFAGVTPVANFGHTPGHTVFMLENSGERLIFAGDFLHIAPVQFPNPDISAAFDVDPALAAVSRRQILEYAAANNVPIAASHIVYPGIGTVEADGAGFRFAPKN